MTSSQASISIIPCTELGKTQFSLWVSLTKRYVTANFVDLWNSSVVFSGANIALKIIYLALDWETNYEW